MDKKENIEENVETKIEANKANKKRKTMLIGLKRFVIFLICMSILVVIYKALYKEPEKVRENAEGNLDKATASSSDTVDDLIKLPDRIVVKLESNYYEISKDDEKYEKIVELFKKNFNKQNEENITEQEIDALKSEKDFVEFDYDKISKNNIFFLSGDIGAVKMKKTDGTIISKKLKNSGSLLNEVKNAVQGKEAYNFESTKIVSSTDYDYYPGTENFEEIEYSKVFKKEVLSYEEYDKILHIYKLDFGDIDLEDKFEKNRIIIILSTYDIADYKVNVGNIKINFEGNNYIIPELSTYKATMLIVSKIVNTNCIYYNYDNVKEVDNITGKTEDFCGVIKSKNDDGSFNLGYNIDNDNMIIGIIKSSDDSLKNLGVGDFVKGVGKITNYKKYSELKTYEVNEFTVDKKEKYEKKLKDYLKGKTELNTSIIDHYESESGYDGFVICPVVIDEMSNRYGIDGYIKIYYDFYEGNTKSYLGMSTHLQDNYGINEYEMVTITFKEKVTDINYIKAEMFEYIAD